MAYGHTGKDITAGEASMMVATPYKIVDLTDTESVNEGMAWWQN